MFCYKKTIPKAHEIIRNSSNLANALPYIKHLISFPQISRTDICL